MAGASKKQSAGALLFKRDGDTGAVSVLLGHPGGPFWAKKDAGAWSIPKGEIEDGEDLVAAARREFAEETGQPLPDGELVSLGSVKIPTGKTIHVWALEADFDTSKLRSNTFEMAWPPKSGQMQSFPEIDRLEWFDLATAKTKMHTGQAEFIDRLAALIGVVVSPASDDTPSHPEQASLF